VGGWAREQLKSVCKLSKYAGGQAGSASDLLPIGLKWACLHTLRCPAEPLLPHHLPPCTGTWSDGKLTTRIGRNSDPVRQVLNTLYRFGAPEVRLRF